MTDMFRLLAMLIGVVDTMEPGSDAWRRPVALVEDAIRTERPSRPLPVHVPLPAAQLTASQFEGSQQFPGSQLPDSRFS
jgi:hypothetical protein